MNSTHVGLKIMKTNTMFRRNLRAWGMREGKIGWILLWLIGIPVPVLLIFFLLRGCT